MATRTSAFVLLAAILIATSTAALAQGEEEEKKTGWTQSADLSYVLTDGNSDTNTLGLSYKGIRAWQKANLTLRFDGIRAETNNEVAVCRDGTCAAPGDFDLVAFNQVTAENYFAEARYDRNVSQKFFWFVGGSWFRNVPAGLDDRYIGFAGVGNTWWDRDDLKFKTDYGLSYTKETDAIPTPDKDDTFSGFRFAWDYHNKFGKTMAYDNDFIVNLNLEETSDFQFNMLNAFTVTMTERLALKISLQWLYDNEPALVSLGLFTLDPNDPGSIMISSVDVPADELDTIFRTSLVINF